MSMQKQLWSVNALAIELDIDRRTMAKRLDGVPPAGARGGHPVWRLSDALAALSGGKTAPPPPPGCEALHGLPAGDALALLLIAEIVHAAPATVAALAVDSGAAEASAGPALELLALGALATTARDVLDAAGLPGDRLAALLNVERLVAARFDLFPGFNAAAAEAKVAAALSA